MGALCSNGVAPVVIVINGLSLSLGAGCVGGKSRTLNEELAHSQDFSSVRVNGVEYTFSPIQAACVKVLYEAWQNGTPDVSSSYLLSDIESDSRHIRDIFKFCPAWKTLIVPGLARGTYRLNISDRS
jgi:hypothetical protein